MHVQGWRCRVEVQGGGAPRYSSSLKFSGVRTLPLPQWFPMILPTVSAIAWGKVSYFKVSYFK